MAKVITKNSFTPGSAPSGLSAGELAVNVADKKLFVGNAVGGVVTLHDQNAIVTSVNGATGAITNVARTNEGNTFSVRQVMNAGFTSAGGDFTKGITFNSTVGNTILFNDTSSIGVTLLHRAPSVSNFATSLTLRSEELDAFFPDPASIKIAGGDSDNVFGSITLDASEIYTTGYFVNPTINGNLILTLNEFIRNSSDGSIDLMPSGSCANHFGLRVDTTSWGYGTRLYSIRGSDNNLTAGSFLFMNGCVINNDVDLGFNSSYSSRIRHTTTGNDTFQIIVTNDASHSGAVAIINQQGVGVVGRSPGITHTNPNLYVYSADHTDANDFIRFEHNQTNANIVSGTGGIVLQPQNSLVSIIGGLTASGNITAPNIRGFTYSTTPPASPTQGDRWLDSDNGREYIYINDGNSSQWIQPVASNGLVGLTYTSATQLYEFGGTASFSGSVSSDGGYRITSNAINSRTGTTYALLASDNGKIITWNATSGATLTVPTGLPIGYNTTVISLGTGLIGISGASGVTLNSFENKLRIAGQHAAVSIISYSSNIFNVAGGLTA